MKTIVMKFGGSSLSTVEKLQHVANLIVDRQRTGAKVAVVVSAMGDTTEEFLHLAEQVASRPSSRELDVLLTAGEQISISLLSMAIQELGSPAVSLTGRQAGFLTDSRHANASILKIDSARVLQELEQNKVAVVAGFQGLSSSGEITTLGRGGSDTSAVALGAALRAECCEIYSDVEGVYSADPRRVPGAALLKEIDYDEMLEFARHGARVLKTDAVETARQYQVVLKARSTFKNGPGTLVGKRQNRKAGEVLGVTGRSDLLRVRLTGNDIPDSLVKDLDECELLYSDPAVDEGLGFVVSSQNLGNVENFVAELGSRYASRIKITPEQGAVTAVGDGIGTDPSVGMRIYQHLKEKGLPLTGSHLSPHSVTCLMSNSLVDEAVGLLHETLVETRMKC